MRNAALLLVGVFLIILQGNLSPVIATINSWGAEFGIRASTPSLVLPLVVFLAVHEASMVRGAVLAFVLGHALGLASSAPPWLFTFVTMVTWWLARVAGVRFAAQTFLTQMTLAFAFSVVESLIVLVLRAIFGADSFRPVEISAVVFPRAAATALCAPLVFGLAERWRYGSLSGRSAGELSI